MLIHWFQHRPILLAALFLLVVALVIVSTDVIQYFGYYFRNYWTESTWVDEVGSAEQQADQLNQEQLRSSATKRPELVKK